MREIAAVTVARSDLGIYLPLMKAIDGHQSLRLRVVASGTHLSPAHGATVCDIERAGFEVFERVESLVASDTPEGVAKSIGLGVIGFAQLFSRYKPDMLVLLGDRFDMLPAGLAALPYRIPVAHLHGGEVTEGVIDEAIRHSLSKISHLHFVSTEEHAARLRQLGEEDWRITISGALALDAIGRMNLMTKEELRQTFDLDFSSPTLLVTYHPVTLEVEDTERHITALLEALSKLGLPCLFTSPNSDTGSQIIIEKVESYCRTHPQSHAIKNAGQRGYWSVMNAAAAMVGNSSSGIIESPSFGLPVVNIGSRQRGRMQTRNVINCGYHTDEIVDAIRRAIDGEFHAGLQGLTNPYGDGQAAGRITTVLASIGLDQRLIQKRFIDHR